jgi:predicted ABC-type ATPase
LRSRRFLSTDEKIDFLARAKVAGYFIRVFFIATSDPRINAARSTLAARQAAEKAALRDRQKLERAALRGNVDVGVHINVWRWSTRHPHRRGWAQARWLPP